MNRRTDGAAVVIALVLAALLVMLGVLGGAVVAIIATHRQLESAADLAALSAASAAQEGEAPCRVADRIGRRNGTVVTRCEIDGDVIAVEVERRLPVMFGGRVLRARARAGPVAPTS